uniref:Uncharacterized protein n=1 Tax=Pavo cristatus TaxID=9049 RepID=A0A8C9F2A2_PAVCR
MPAGVPWSTYLKTLAASMLAMFAGAEVVHRYYRPDLVSAAQGHLQFSLRLDLGRKNHKLTTEPHG